MDVREIPRRLALLHLVVTCLETPAEWTSRAPSVDEALARLQRERLALAIRRTVAQRGESTARV